MYLNFSHQSFLYFMEFALYSLALTVLNQCHCSTIDMKTKKVVYFFSVDHIP